MLHITTILLGRRKFILKLKIYLHKLFLDVFKEEFYFIKINTYIKHFNIITR